MSLPVPSRHTPRVLACGAFGRCLVLAAAESEALHPSDGAVWLRPSEGER